MDVKRKTCETIEVDKTSTTQKIYVIRGLEQALLGRPAIRALGLIKELAEVTIPKAIKDKFPNLFKGLMCMDEEYKIELHPDATPHAINTARRVPLPLLDKVKQELKRMEDLGVISLIDKPTEWCAGMVVVQKPSGGVQICVDLTKLNESVKGRDMYFLVWTKHLHSWPVQRSFQTLMPIQGTGKSDWQRKAEH